MALASGQLVGRKYRLERPIASGGMGAGWAARQEPPGVTGAGEVLSRALAAAPAAPPRLPRAARQEPLGVTVAVKLISGAMAADPAARQRFEREARAAAQLRSPHVVQVLDYGVEDDLPYMAMEMLHGEDLAAHLARRGRLSVR